MKRYLQIVALAIPVLMAFEATAHAYIGPGAGFAIVTSFLTLLTAFAAAAAALLFWPVRALRTMLIRLKYRKGRTVRRVVLIGLDGLDPDLAERYMSEGLMPSFAALAAEGSFKRLSTTFPAISPVAWSTFSTGVNPGKHRIFDFYTRDPKTYAPTLSSTRTGTAKKRIGIGPIARTITRPAVTFLRKSTSFWRTLGDARVFCSVNRVPVTYPPESFYGTCLSAMCTPDLRGTQGSFTLLGEGITDTGGQRLDDGTRLPITVDGDRFTASLPGPTIAGNGNGSGQPLTITLSGSIDRNAGTITLTTDGETLQLTTGEYSPWVTLTFSGGRFRKVTGIARFLVTAIEPTLMLYVTPLNISPERPAMPVSHPGSYAPSLAGLYGPFATLGLAEDTWALNEQIIDEDAFLTQSYDIFEERRQHLFDALKKNRDGVVTTVFDTTDRIQHMFFRYLDRDHPANADKDTIRHADAIENLYRRMDTLIGEVRNTIGPDDLLIVLSDHGFAPFKWGVNLNTWLRREGYLVLRDGAGPGGKWFAEVDWTQTRAYACGLAGIFLNVQGREAQGIVPRAEHRALAEEIAGKLESLSDERTGIRPIRRAAIATDIYRGPYVGESHDIMVGFERGYRVSWNSAVGMVTDNVIEDNTKRWSGDHCMDPDLVPGVLFSNWRLGNETPAMQDIAPTMLDLFGLPPAPFHDGRALNLNRPGTEGAHP